MVKGMGKKRLFEIAHARTKNFKVGYKEVHYSVQLSIFLKEVYKLKKIIENKIRKTFVNNFKLKYFRTDYGINGLVVTIKFFKGNDKHLFSIDKEHLKWLLSHPDLDKDIKKMLKELFEYLYEKLRIEKKIDFNKYIEPRQYEQLSLF